MKRLLFALITLTAVTVKADFGEIDLMVRESLETEIAELGLNADMNRLHYAGEPSLTGKVMTVRSEVWADDRWYTCTTGVLIESPGHYRDLGTKCAPQ